MDIRESIEKAMEPAAEVLNEQPKETVEKPEGSRAAEQPSGSADAGAGGDSGGDAGKPKTDDSEQHPAKQQASDEAEKPADEKDEKPKVDSGVKPPVSWRAGAKERWATLPPEVKEEVVRREREASVALQNNAEAARFAEQFNRTIEPYRAIIAAEGAPNALAAVQNLFQTATTLRMGTPIQKADLVARLINIYGVDVQVLDGLLSGQQTPEVRSQAQLDKLLNERLTPLQQELQQYRQMFGNQQQNLQAQAKVAIDEFAERNEFVDDPEIANEMADLLEVAARRGRKMSIQEAYDRAVQAHPTISKIFAQRKQAEEARKQKMDAERIKNASSSVKGSPMGGADTQNLDPNNIRGFINAAFERR